MDKKDRINLDLDFLGEGAADTASQSERARKSVSAKAKHEPKQKSSGLSENAKKWIAGTIVALVASTVAVLAYYDDAGTTSTTPPVASQNNTAATATIPGPVQDDSSIGVKNSDDNIAITDDTPVDPTPHQSGYDICRDRNGSFATYDSESNSCGCVTGYYYGATSQQCVSYTEARDQSCAARWPGTSFLKVDPVDGKNVCDCVAGSYWNNDETACYSQSSFTQSCQNSFGMGSYSTIQEGKRVCDCSYGYSFNIERDACVTTASINQMCERDVGRNSRYTGRVEDGKYSCTEPY